MKKINLMLVASFIALAPLSAHAYIDPGSGSAIMSVIIGFIVAIGVVIKTFWYKIMSILGLSKKKTNKDKS